MTKPPSDVMQFLLTRRSRPARTLVAPVPDRATLGLMLTAAARVPDHGKLEPWRFIVLERPALARLAALAAERGAAMGIDPEKRAKGVAQYADSPLAVVVVKRPRPTEKVPEVEQILSTGAACLSLLNAAEASGFAANWLTGWMLGDKVFLRDGLGLAAGEWVAGVVHIGTPAMDAPERPRPDVAALTEWLSA